MIVFIYWHYNDPVVPAPHFTSSFEWETSGSPVNSNVPMFVTSFDAELAMCFYPSLYVSVELCRVLGREGGKCGAILTF